MGVLGEVGVVGWVVPLVLVPDVDVPLWFVDVDPLDWLVLVLLVAFSCWDDELFVVDCLPAVVLGEPVLVPLDVIAIEPSWCVSSVLIAGD